MGDDDKRPRRARAQPSWVLANGHVLSESAALKRALKASLLETHKEKGTAGRRRVSERRKADISNCDNDSSSIRSTDTPNSATVRADLPTANNDTIFRREVSISKQDRTSVAQDAKESKDSSIKGKTSLPRKAVTLTNEGVELQIDPGEGNGKKTNDESDSASRRDKRMKFRRDFLEDTMRETTRSPRKKYCAQRKFAQNFNGGGYSSSPMATPVKAFLSPGPSHPPPPPPLILPAAATQATSPLKPTCKTEDFLTFLCLRGTSLCPEDLKFLEHPTSFDNSRSDDKLMSMVAKTKRNLQGKLAEVEDSRPKRARDSTDSMDSQKPRKDLVTKVAKLIAAKYKKGLNGVGPRRLSTRQSSSDSRSSATSTPSRAERLKIRQNKMALLEKENKRRTNRLVKTDIVADNLTTGSQVQEHPLNEVRNAPQRTETVAQRRSALIRSQSRRTQQHSRRGNLIARSLVKRAKSGKPGPPSNVGAPRDSSSAEEGRRATRSLGPIAEVALPIWPQYKLKQYELSLSKKGKKTMSPSVAAQATPTQAIKMAKRIDKRRSERITHDGIAIASPRKTMRHRRAPIEEPKTISEAITSIDVNDRIDNLVPISSDLINTSADETTLAINGLISSKFEGDFGLLSTRDILSTSTSTTHETPVKTSLNFMSDCGSPCGSVISRTSDTCFRKQSTPTEPTAASKTNKTRKNQAIRWSSLSEPPPSTSTSPAGTTGKCEISPTPVFEPTLEDFQDPLKYIRETITKIDVTKHSMFKIITPLKHNIGSAAAKDAKMTVRQSECKVSSEMRFLAYNQFLHKMWKRWGPSALQYACLRKALKISEGRDNGSEEPLEDKILYKSGNPLIGGVEIDIGHLYETVQNFGGIQAVMEKKKWVRVADAMRIPRMAHDRVARLDDAYMRYCLPLEVMSDAEKEDVLNKVKEEREKRRAQDLWDENETRECVWPGRNMTLAVFERIARNTHTMWYPRSGSTVGGALGGASADIGAAPDDVEHDFWAIVESRKRHIVVNCGNIDTLAYGCGFPAPPSGLMEKILEQSGRGKKTSAADKTNSADGRVVPWNTKLLARHPDNVLRWLGGVSGVTIPTLHVSMLFTALPWYRDPHNVNWLDYLHSGAPKIWYSVPSSQADRFHRVVSRLAPHVHQSDVGVPSDACLIPPRMLLDRGVPLQKMEQRPGEMIVILQGCYSSNVSCGFSLSESVYFTWDDWINQSWQRFQTLRENSEPPTFCLEQLVVNMALEGAGGASSVEGSTRGDSLGTKVLSDIWCVLNRMVEELSTSWNVLEVAGVPNERREQSAFPVECADCRMLCGLAAAVCQRSPEEVVCLVDAQARLDAPLSSSATSSTEPAVKSLKTTRATTTASPRHSHGANVRVPIQNGLQQHSTKFKIVYCYSMEELKSLSTRLQQKIV
ncbi:jumonji/arid domain-containing protein-like [Tropilaelaps mercedesae]|uniref:Jumonji/arid domain-containing protein-like n=1 Tax=Tropilaelaps mercedesae TaxID=418985 RepID=A0A1V9XLE9_9ACAR|nr:jumonji/arid domain-containing protein-like [Tropilaelaps mercedesae]